MKSANHEAEFTPHRHLQDELVGREIRHSPTQACVLGLQFFEALHLIELETAELVAAPRISSRSANDRKRSDGGLDDRERCEGGMPPPCRNHRSPTAGDTPAPTAESSLERPAAINAQNWRRS